MPDRAIGIDDGARCLASNAIGGAQLELADRLNRPKEELLLIATSRFVNYRRAGFQQVGLGGGVIPERHVRVGLTECLGHSPLGKSHLLAVNHPRPDALPLDRGKGIMSKLGQLRGLTARQQRYPVRWHTQPVVTAGSREDKAGVFAHRRQQSNL